MRDLPCTRLEMDEIWGFVGKRKECRALMRSGSLADVWTFCAIDAETKLVPAFKVGERDAATAKAFVERRGGPDAQPGADLHRWLRAYVEAIEVPLERKSIMRQIVKTYGTKK